MGNRVPLSSDQADPELLSQLQRAPAMRERIEELTRLNQALLAEIDERRRVEHGLREAERRKDNFLATFAHELRNRLAPLTSTFPLIAAQSDRPELVRQL